MSKKKKSVYEEDDNLTPEEIQDDIDESLEDELSESENDIVIVLDEAECSDDSSETEEEEEVEEQPVKKKNKFNNHRLKYDSIFKGKKHDTNADEFSPDFLVPKQSTFDLIDHYNSEDHYRILQLEEIIYQFVIEKTSLNISAPRRKPGKNDFNRYMVMLSEYVDTSLYTHSEIFSVFSTYFSDNLFSMFRLLDKKMGALVAKELKISHKKNFDDLEIV